MRRSPGTLRTHGLRAISRFSHYDESGHHESRRDALGNQSATVKVLLQPFWFQSRYEVHAGKYDDVADT